MEYTLGGEVAITGTTNHTISTLLIGDKTKPVTTDSQVNTDSKLELLNLPRFTVQDFKDMMKVRVRVPLYSKLCLKAFGIEFFSACVSGEGQLITEPYVPNAAERCEINCCEPDTRPFPYRVD